VTTTDPVTVIPAAAPDFIHADVGALNRYLAEYITGLHRINGRFVYITAIADDNAVTVDVTRRRFDDHDNAARITWAVTGPETIEPAELLDEISPYTQALLDVQSENGSVDA
jgi:hypothetical protein